MTPADLDAHLAERVRPVAPSGRTATGELVLYWMHHAVRAEENPALDAANASAAALGLPLLVYQGLGGRHPYDSDRHHTFIMEGARDVAAALAARGMRHVLHLGRGREAQSPLGALAARAALVVTEDFPAPPFPAWTRALARRIRAPVWRVDTACVLPMRCVERAFARAYEFRRAHGRALLERARASWPACDAVAEPFSGDPGFEPVDLSRADLAALCAACAIDHAVGPVPETRGGTRAALERWSLFLDWGLAGYDRWRNDAAIEPPRGVSRISPYLHHGQLSPFRVAREASAQPSSGAEKFLDELLVWRELAHNFCFHNEHRRGGLASLDRLPEWARETLRKHASDPREETYDWERLARAQTGDALWDAAQRSLLIHGELHNNLRMTWGKALLGWTPSPQRALELMVDLNHRYALDGSDPNSYGGLLYCLGLFDRPFTPEQPVFGAVRPRSTHAHARRLDLARYRARANVRGTSPAWRVAVIGAGIAGLAAARALHDQGFSVRVLERGRGVGGRTSHRRSAEHRFDHGAQYFTARDPRFVRVVESWVARGLVAPWPGRIVALDANRTPSPVAAEQRFVGVPGMHAMARHLAQDIEVTTECAVTGLVRDAGAWHVATASDTTLGPFDALVIAMPPEQIARLDAPRPLIEPVGGDASLPCWCAMAAFDAPLAVEFDGAFVNGAVLDWVARDSSKPGRPAGERWVMHSSAQWASERLDAPRDEIAPVLLAEFFAALGVPACEPAYLAAHRWSYARPAREQRPARTPHQRPAAATRGGKARGLAPSRRLATNAGENTGRDCVWAAEDAVALCGDWCRGGRVEGAFSSGVAAAGRVAGAAVAHQGMR